MALRYISRSRGQEGKRAIGRLCEWANGRVGDGETERQRDWETERQELSSENWKVGMLQVAWCMFLRRAG